MKYPVMRFFAADQGEAGAPASSPSSSEATPASAEPAAPSGADANSAPQPSGDAAAVNAPEPTSLSVAQAAVAPEGEAGASVPPGKEGEQGAAATPPAAQVQQPPVALDEKAQAEADKQLPFHTHPRWQQVNQERREALETIEKSKWLVEEGQALQTFMRSHDIPAAEVSNALNILAAMKTDPLKAREMLAETIKKLDEFAGEILPTDLQQKVDGGIIDNETAKEMAKLRHQQAFGQNRTKEQQERDQQQQQQTQFQQLQQAVYTASASWEGQKRTSDPDYAAKAPLIDKEVKAIMFSEGPAKTAEAAVAMLERAYAAVNEHFKQFAPTRKPTATTVRSGTSIPATTPTPTNSLDVARLALQ